MCNVWAPARVAGGRCGVRGTGGGGRPRRAGHGRAKLGVDAAAGQRARPCGKRRGRRFCLPPARQRFGWENGPRLRTTSAMWACDSACANWPGDGGSAVRSAAVAMPRPAGVGGSALCRSTARPVCRQRQGGWAAVWRRTAFVAHLHRPDDAVALHARKQGQRRAAADAQAVHQVLAGDLRPRISVARCVAGGQASTAPRRAA
jgi:hypothetical protein